MRTGQGRADPGHVQYSRFPPTANVSPPTARVSPPIARVSPPTANVSTPTARVYRPGRQCLLASSGFLQTYKCVLWSKG